MEAKDQKALWPHFLVIGAGKSGTTSLHEYLKQHPQIFMARKEPNFFAYENLDPSTLDGPDDRKHYAQSFVSPESYLNLFAEAREGQLRGEVSNTYISKDGAWANIQRRLPEVKLIAILRHPAERLFSRYTHLLRDGQDLAGAPEAFFDRQSLWWRRSDLVQEGFYHQRLKPFFDHFPREQIKVFLYEDFVGNTKAVMREIFTFLGVDASVEVETEVVYNKSGTVKNPMVHRIIGPNSFLIRSGKALFPGLLERLKEGRFYAWLNQQRNRNLQKPKLSAALWQRLVDEVYAEDIRQLAGLLEKDLDAWLKYPDAAKV